MVLREERFKNWETIKTARATRTRSRSISPPLSRFGSFMR